MKVKIYTDGACSGNPGPGGWAVVVNTDSGFKQFSGYAYDTTNNRMELTAVLEALSYILNDGSKETMFEIYSDSAYVVNALIKGWVWEWEGKNWYTKAKASVKNKDLWIRIIECLRKIKKAEQQVRLFKVKGHSGNMFNELCDKLAKEAADRAQSWNRKENKEQKECTEYV